MTTPAIDATGADILFIMLSHYDAVVCSTCINDSTGLNQWNHIAALDYDDGITIIQWYYTQGDGLGVMHTSSSQTFLTESCTGCFPYLAAAAFSGSYTTSSPVDQTNGATSAGAASLGTGNITPTTGGQLILTAAGSNLGSNTFSGASGFTIVQSHTAVSGQTVGGAMAYVIQGSSASTASATWNITSSADIAVNIGSFKVGSVPPPPSSSKRCLLLLGVSCGE